MQWPSSLQLNHLLLGRLCLNYLPGCTHVALACLFVWHNYVPTPTPTPSFLRLCQTNKYKTKVTIVILPIMMSYLVFMAFVLTDWTERSHATIRWRHGVGCFCVRCITALFRNVRQKSWFEVWFGSQLPTFQVLGAKHVSNPG